MPRETASAEKIRIAVQDVLDAMPDVEVDGDRVAVGAVRRQGPDASGCNWVLDTYEGADSFGDLVAQSVALVQQRYNLPD